MVLPFLSFTENSGSGGLTFTPSAPSQCTATVCLWGGNGSGWPGSQGGPVNLISPLGLWREAVYQLPRPPLCPSGHWAQGQDCAKIKSTLISYHVRVCWIKLRELYLIGMLYWTRNKLFTHRDTCNLKLVGLSEAWYYRMACKWKWGPFTMIGDCNGVF